MTKTPPSDPSPNDRVRDEREIAASLRLRPERPKVVRISRRVLGGLIGCTAIVLSFALIWALQSGNGRFGSDELYNTENHNEAEGLSRLPRDYSDIPRDVPKLGPPLPGDLGRPMRNAGVEAPAFPAAPIPAAPKPDPDAERLAEERRRLAQEREAARLSELFTEARGEDVAASTPKQGDASSEGGPSPNPFAPESFDQQQAQPTETDRKLAFLNGPIDRRTVSADRIQAPASRYVLQAGAVIPAALMTGLRSDLPGQVTAQVTEQIYDSPTGRSLLIPQGSKLIGQYDAQVAFGQKRAFLVWTRLIMPNGRSIVLERQPGADPSGYAGLEDDVDNHWGQIFRAALVTTLLNIGTQVGSGSAEDELIQAIRSGSSDSIDQIGRQLVGRSLNIQPTLTVRPGFPVRVMVTRDLVLEPYRG